MPLRRRSGTARRTTNAQRVRNFRANETPIQQALRLTQNRQRNSGHSGLKKNTVQLIIPSLLTTTMIHLCRWVKCLSFASIVQPRSGNVNQKQCAAWKEKFN